MAVVENQCCEGCGKRFDVDDLHVVSVQGTEMVCCSECREHARRAAERTLTKCERCENEVPESTLARVEFPDRSELYCCSNCRDELRDGASNTDSPSASGGRTTASNESTASTTANGRSMANDPTEANGTATKTNGKTRSNGTQASSTGESSDESGGESDDSSKPARTENVCDQCGDSFTIELYKVVTVDNRTEEFCPDCKRQAVEEGIIRDVQLRRAQAFEALGLTGSADQQAIREAYLRRAKEVHPDRDGGSRSEFMMVKRAYERLTEES